MSPDVKVSKCCKSLKSRLLGWPGIVVFSPAVLPVTASGDRLPGHKERPEEANSCRRLIYCGGKLPPCGGRYRQETCFFLQRSHVGFFWSHCKLVKVLFQKIRAILPINTSKEALTLILRALQVKHPSVDFVWKRRCLYSRVSVAAAGVKLRDASSKG